MRKPSARLQRVINKIARAGRSPRDYGTGELLHLAEIQAVYAVAEHPGIGVTGLARELGVTKGTVSPLVGRLVDREYLEKCRSAGDGRAVRLQVTGKGQWAAEVFEQYAEEYYSKYAEGVSLGEWTIFNEIVVKLEAFIDSQIEKGS